jgi:hypothetical protein
MCQEKCRKTMFTHLVIVIALLHEVEVQEKCLHTLVVVVYT